MSEPTSKPPRKPSSISISRKYERKRRNLNASFRRITDLVDSQPLAAAKATRKTVQSVLLTLLKTDHWNPTCKKIGSLWAMAKGFMVVKRPMDGERNARDSFFKGLAWLEQGMLMTLDNLLPDGSYWSSRDGIERSLSTQEVRLVALIAQIASLYFLEVAEDNEHSRFMDPDQADPIPF